MSSESDKRADAVRLLKEREGDVAKGMPITADVGKMRFDEAAEDLLTDYRVNRKRSLRTVTLRIFFGERRLAAIAPPLIRQHVAHRQASGASNATINRDLITLKRMFNLAMQSGKLMARPYIPLLKESNVRKGVLRAGTSSSGSPANSRPTCAASQNLPSSPAGGRQATIHEGFDFLIITE